MQNPLPEASGWPTSPFLAAAGGAVFGALRSLPGATVTEKAVNAVLAFMFAIFVGPAFVEWLGVTSERIAAGIIFAWGAVGLVTYTAIVEGIRQTAFGTILTGWLTGWRRKDG